VLAIVGALVVTQITIGVTGMKPLPGGGYRETAPLIGATVAGQYGVWFLWMLLVSRRKGLGTLRADFGFVIDLARDWSTIAIGFGFEIAAGIALFPITNLVKKTPQQVVHDLDTAHGPKLAILVVTAIVIAPVVEELFFRGLLLRALQRRVSAPMAVALAALAFGLTHLLFDFGSGAVLPALVALGLVSGYLAVRTGNLSRSILLHAGFNLVAVLAVLTNH
jgi:membrane protease YdiL (CAAX protease family)